MLDISEEPIVGYETYIRVNLQWGVAIHAHTVVMVRDFHGILLILKLCACAISAPLSFAAN